MLVAIVAAAVLPAVAQTNPVKLATSARFDLFASAAVGGISNGVFLTGGGAAGRMTWLAPVDQPRSYTASFPAPHFAWTEAVFRFTPQSNGTVELKIMGPWEEPPGGGLIYKQEVLWDGLTGTNTALANGGFEFASGALPIGWTSPYGSAVLETNAALARDGRRMARVWHDSPFTQQLTVTSGVPVTLRLFARGHVPPGWPDMARILNSNSPAHLAARRFMRGVNLGNYLEAPPGEDWGASYSTNDFVWIRNEGFDHVRLPVAWHHHTDGTANYTISNSFAAKVDFLVTNALNRGLNVLLNIHHFDDFTTSPAAWTNKFYALWRQIGARYSNFPSGLAFELLNEPKDAATTTVLNPIYAEAIRQIRLSNPARTIFAGPGQFNSIDELVNLRLPDSDSNLVVTVHCYDPFLFTHQGAAWIGADTATTGIRFPGPPPAPLTPAAGIPAWATNWINDYNTLPTELNPSSSNAFRGRILLAKQWSDYYGRPVHVGEFGAYDTYCDDASRVNFYAHMRGLMDALGLGWAMWDWKAGFHYWQQTGPGAGAPEPAGMREAIFPKPEIRLNQLHQIEHHGAVGKTYFIQQTTQLASVTTWVNLATQTLTIPELVFSVSDSNAAPGSFFRLEWVK